MKHYKGNMLLVELIIAILFFSLSQVVIVQVFAAAQHKAEYSSKLRDALIAAEDVAERLSGEKTPEPMLLGLGFANDDGIYVLHDEAGFDLYVSLNQRQENAGTLMTATLTAKLGADEMFSLPSAYYIAKEGEP